MGWDHTQGATRNDIIKYLIKDDRYGAGSTCLKHAARGNILWAVIQVTPEDTFILCALLGKLYENERDPSTGRKYLFGWGYKDMTESMHPYYYTCPESFLDLAPVACQEWRDKVRAEAAKGRRKVEVGRWYALPGRKPNKVRVVSLSPMRGFAENGLMYKVSKKMLGDVIEQEVA